MKNHIALTEEQKIALKHAEHLAAHGIPIFLAIPDLDDDGNWIPDGGHQKTGYWFPKRWQQTEADASVVERWRPGMALGLVTGHVVDLFDVDPRSGGAESQASVLEARKMPHSYGQQASPSGGTHDFIASLGVRSLDKVFPGIDVKSGEPNGQGRGFAFIAPTVKLSKITGEPVSYQWIDPPDVAMLSVIGGDNSGAALAKLVRDRGRGENDRYDDPSYSGPPYAEMSTTEQRLADGYAESVVELWRDRLREATEWPEGQTDSNGRGWELLARDSAWSMALLAAAPWTPTDEDQAEALYNETLPDEFAITPECVGKWYSGIVEKAGQKVRAPWWQDFLPVADDPEDWPDVPVRLDDAHLVAWLYHKGLEGRWLWAKGLGWMYWEGRRWIPRAEEDVREAVRLTVIEANRAGMTANVTRARMQDLAALLSVRRITGLTSLMRGPASADPGSFDQQPDLLNCGNGVVDLRTGQLWPHDPKWRLTRITTTDYVADKHHEDWNIVLTALDSEVADWIQVRLGQAVTGHPTSDDVLPIGQGGGSNGKSTLLAGLYGALQEHVTQVPEKLIRANPNDHSTEYMSLRGARIAVIDETPEVGQLNVQRIKATVGQLFITARGVHQDNVTWKSTHSLFAMSNYIPLVSETDHGTWRRLALVRFTKTFPRNDKFRARVARGAHGLHEAVLYWVVFGARKWYMAERTIYQAPHKVVEDTNEWRAASDLVFAYLLEERLAFDPDACVLTREVYEDFNEWLAEKRQKPWSERMFNSRFGEHQEITRQGVYKNRPLHTPENLVRRYGGGVGETRSTVWVGLRWRISSKTENG